MAGGVKRGFGMPLLGKELREQAARKGTYVARVVYAVLLFGAFLIGTDWMWVGRFDVLGRGRQMLEMLVVLQFCGIYLFLPAMMSRTIAEEKEKETLVLLFLTDMGPWELLLQKYLGRLIPMFCFLLLALPLMAIAYAYGGIDASMLGWSVWMVFLCCLQTGAFALMCSAYCQTFVGACVASYVGLALFYGVAGAYFPPALWSEAFRGYSGMSVGSSGVFVLMSIVILLVGAKCFLVRRAFLMPRNPILGLFGALDRIFGRWNAKMGGYTMWKGKQTLPVDDPVAWREQQKRGIGRPHHLCRLGLLIMVPTVLIGMVAVVSGPRDEFTSLVFAGWSLAGLAMVVQGANLIAVERSRQTLEVLLMTPMAASEIVRQKMCALRRFGVLLAVPLLAFAGFGLLRRWDSDWRMWLYIVSYLLAVPVLFAILAWGGMWVGLRVKSRGRAVVLALVALAAWCVLPVVVLMSVFWVSELDFLIIFLPMLSPAAVVFMLELVQSESWSVGICVLVAVLLLVWYGYLASRVRRLCLRNAERLLRGA